jgi:hypothetical protein
LVVLGTRPIGFSVPVAAVFVQEALDLTAFAKVREVRQCLPKCEPAVEVQKLGAKELIADLAGGVRFSSDDLENRTESAIVMTGHDPSSAPPILEGSPMSGQNQTWVELFHGFERGQKLAEWIFISSAPEIDVWRDRRQQMIAGDKNPILV